ncbi:hypothetical protein E2562_011056 [Oryza meyeriana var. granulata]|uniref:Uncharacterized protein n=1 Tax=Oryza meyeriana var. granulata TaxID=110450 RepID=A0A6G1EWE6_9ORYZ|nr:hypothetical protein E2562_011056 [Oryza meyeriana var. granulata]
MPFYLSLHVSVQIFFLQFRIPCSLGFLPVSPCISHRFIPSSPSGSLDFWKRREEKRINCRVYPNKDDENFNNSNISDGVSWIATFGPKLDTGVYGKSDWLDFDRKMVEASNPTQDMIDITGHVVHDDVSYDKDVLEIKLPDTVVTSDYGGNFVKDVCIDEGVLPHRKISEEKKLDEKSPPNFDFLVIDANSDLRYGGKGDATKYAHEQKPETVLLPVGLAAEDNTEKQCDIEGKSTASVASDISEKKISLQELLKLESAEESQERLKLESAEESQTQHESTTTTAIGANHMPPVHGEAVGQASINDCHDVATASKTDELITGGSPATISDRHDATAEFDKPLSTIEIANSLSGSKKFNDVGTEESRPDALISSSSSDVQPSERSNDDHQKSFTSEVVTNGLDETALASSSSSHAVESSDTNRENKNKNSDNDGDTDVHDFNQTDEHNCADATTGRKISMSSADAQKDSTHVGGLNVPDNAKGKSPIGNGYPLEPCSLGPSIMCNPVSTSGHIGNISIRSDSSTTSTRSFAFPVLQSDWTSSPVRMAKAERRRTRRRRGWKKGFLCWKF